MLLILLICLKKNSHTYILARYCCILKENTNVLNIFKIMSYFTCSAPIKWLMDYFSQFVYVRHFAGKKIYQVLLGFFLWIEKKI